ncbi:MAG: hypothetical protein H7141_01130 [Burkholderiales bacterium]|nr:hypothetical protein [Bacteroidia bacterium]
MKLTFLYTFLFLFFTARYICQDVIVKKDSTRIKSKILEIRPDEIKFKYFDYQDGPLITLSKKEVAYIFYLNGTKEIFKEVINLKADSFYYAEPIVWQGDTTRSKKHTEPKIGDYIKFNVQVGAVMNSLSANYTRREPPAQRTASEKYSASSNKYIFNYNIGFNFLFGNNAYIKHVIGVNYLRSKGEYNYSSGSLGSSDGYGGRTTHSEDFHYVSKLDFINIVTGLRLKLFKKLYIEPLASINIIVQSDVRQSGASTVKYISGGPTPTLYKTETEYFSNKKVSAERTGINSTISLCPKISYDFDFNKQTLGVCISYNLAYEFRLPWIMVGFTYYPFKKLR